MRKFKRLTLTLALLIMAVGGAWAQDALTVKELVPPATWETDENNLTPADLPGFYTSTFDKAKAWTGAPAEGSAMLIYAFEGDDAHYVSFDKGTPEDKDYKFTFTKASVLFMTKIYYTVEPANPTEWLLTPDADKKVWTLYKMPASNIELQVEYFAESNLFLSKEALADKANIAVKAGDLGLQFDKDGKSANTVTEGTPMTVKFNGTKKLLGMKVAKKAPTLLSIQIDGHVTATIYYFEGETWEQAIQNQPTENSAWKIDNGNISANGANLFAGGNYEKVNPNSTIDPKANYHLLWT